MADMVLTAQEDGEDAHRLFHFQNFEPENGPIHRDTSDPVSDVRPQCSSIRSRSQGRSVRTNQPDPASCPIERVHRIVPDVPIGSHQMVEYQGEIAFGIGGEFNPPNDASAA